MRLKRRFLQVRGRRVHYLQAGDGPLAVGPDQPRDRLGVAMALTGDQTDTMQEPQFRMTK